MSSEYMKENPSSPVQSGETAAEVKLDNSGQHVAIKPGNVAKEVNDLKAIINPDKNHQSDDDDVIQSVRPVSIMIKKGIKNHQGKLSMHELAWRCRMVSDPNGSASPVMSMLSSGKMRLPMDKMAYVAKELNINLRSLMMAQMFEAVQYNLVRSKGELRLKDLRECWKPLQDLMLQSNTANEAEFVKVFRQVEQEVGYELVMDDEFKKDLKDLLEKHYKI